MRLGIILAKELSQRFPSKNIRLVLNMRAINPDYAKNIFARLWPVEEMIKYRNVSLIEVEGLYSKVPHADLGIHAILKDSRPIRFPAPQVELLFRENDLEYQGNHIWRTEIRGRRRQIVELGLGADSIGVLVPYEIIERSKEKKLEKKALCERFAEAEVSQALLDPAKIENIVNTKWSTIVAQEPKSIASFLCLIEKLRQAEEKISVFIINKTDTLVNARITKILSNAGIKEIRVIDSSGEVLLEGTGNITIYLLGVIPNSLMVPLFRACDKPVLVSGNSSCWEAAAAGAVWLYAMEGWHESFLIGICDFFRNNGEEEIAKALHVFANPNKHEMRVLDSQLECFKPLFQNNAFFEKYARIARLIFEKRNLLFGDGLERALERAWLNFLVQPEESKAYKVENFLPLTPTRQSLRNRLAPAQAYSQAA